MIHANNDKSSSRIHRCLASRFSVRRGVHWARAAQDQEATMVTSPRRVCAVAHRRSRACCTRPSRTTLLNRLLKNPSGPRRRLSGMARATWRLGTCAVERAVAALSTPARAHVRLRCPIPLRGPLGPRSGAACAKRAAAKGLPPFARHATKQIARKASPLQGLHDKMPICFVALLGIVEAPGTAARGAPARGNGQCRAPDRPRHGRRHPAPRSHPPWGPCSALRGLATTFVARLAYEHFSCQTRLPKGSSTAC